MSKTTPIQKGTVLVNLGVIYEGMTVDDLLKLVYQAQQRAEQEGITNIRITSEAEYGYYNDASIRTCLEGMRPETDEEHQIRVDNWKRNQEQIVENTALGIKRMSKKERARLMALLAEEE